METKKKTDEYGGIEEDTSLGSILIFGLVLAIIVIGFIVAIN